MLANINLIQKHLFMLSAAAALDLVTILLGGVPQAFGLMIYHSNGIVKHAIASPNVLAKVLLGHLQSQLKFEPGICEGLQKHVNEDEIKAFLNTPFDENNKEAEVYLANLIKTFEKGMVATDTATAYRAQGSSVTAPILLYEYPTVNHFMNAIPEFTNLVVTTNLYASHRPSVKPAVLGKPPHGPKRSAEKDTKQQFDKTDAQKKCKEGFDAGVKKASELLTTNKGDHIKMAIDMAKHIQSMKPIFKTTDSKKDSMNLFFPLEFVNDKFTWQLPAARGGEFLDGNFLGQFIVLRGLLGYKNSQDKQLPTSLHSSILVVKAHKMAEKCK